VFKHPCGVWAICDAIGWQFTRTFLLESQLCLSVEMDGALCHVQPATLPAVSQAKRAYTFRSRERKERTLTRLDKNLSDECVTETQRSLMKCECKAGRHLSVADLHALRAEYKDKPNRAQFVLDSIREAEARSTALNEEQGVKTATRYLIHTVNNGAVLACQACWYTAIGMSRSSFYKRKMDAAEGVKIITHGALGLRNKTSAALSMFFVILLS